MPMFKRSCTAMAIALACSVPAFAQETDVAPLALPEGFVAPEGNVVLQFAGTDALFIAPYETAAELCQVSEGEFAAVAESGVDVIFCEQIDEADLATFTETDDVETLVDRRSGDNDDDDGSEAVAGDDDADDAAEGETGDDAGAGDDDTTDDGSTGTDVGDADDTTGDDAGTGDDTGSGETTGDDADGDRDDGAEVDAGTGN